MAWKIYIILCIEYMFIYIHPFNLIALRNNTLIIYILIVSGNYTQNLEIIPEFSKKIF